MGGKIDFKQFDVLCRCSIEKKFESNLQFTQDGGRGERNRTCSLRLLDAIRSMLLNALDELLCDRRAGEHLLRVGQVALFDI